MAFRYIDIGNGKGIVSSSYRVVTENLKYSTTGKAFTANFDNTSYSTYYFGFWLPEYIANDIWIKFDLYIDSNNDASDFNFGYWNRSDTYSNKNFSWLEGLYLYYGELRLNMDCNYSNTAARANLNKKAINKVWCHIHNEVGTSKSYGELNVNGKRTAQTVTRSGYDYAIGNQVDALKNMIIRFPKAYPCYISNLIISNEYISPKEQVIALPVSQTITDMTAGASGIYIADAANQQLLQSVDVSLLIENYGASSAITGISLVGNPAYKTAEGLANLTALSKAGGSIAEHDTIELSGDLTAVIMDGWGLSGVTIADLQDMQFGWKVGE